MEENGRVTVKKVERPDGMTEYLLEYIPPIMISEGNYLKEEHLNLAVYTKPCNDIERHFNETVEVIVEEIRCFRYIQSVKKDFSFLSLKTDLSLYYPKRLFQYSTHQQVMQYFIKVIYKK